MRLPLTALVLTLLAPASAEAGTVALEGTELVFRADPGQRDQLVVMPEEGAVEFRSDGDIDAGTGCADRTARRARCPSAGVKAIRILAGDGSDSIVAGGPLPLFADLGPGDDELGAGGSDLGQQTSVTVDAGPGNDEVEASAESAAVSGGAGDDRLVIDSLSGAKGPFAIKGGAGDDAIDALSRAPTMTLSGGAGDDRIAIPGETGPAVTVRCGSGGDQWLLGPRDEAGNGCAPRFAGVTRRTVARVFREGSLTGTASGSVTLRRRVRDQGRPREIIARGNFTARSGSPRIRLTPTSAGRRWLRRNPRLPVFVYVATRRAGDRGLMTFSSRMR